MPVLAARGPVLVQFFDFSQLNSVRTLPYLAEWDRRYRERGLTVLGVQSPRFEFGADPDLVAAGLERLGVGYPVLVDRDRLLWESYGCEGWPSLFLWGKGGILRWFHFGEGEYRATEEAIRESLGPPGELSGLPAPMDPVRPIDAEGVEVIAPGAELFPAEGRPWSRSIDGAGFDVEYEGGGVHATVEGTGLLKLALDGETIAPVPIDGAGLYTLAEHKRHGTHRIGIELEGDPRIWSVSFSPAPAASGH
ncbi:MAG: DipZ protein [Solirubrobacterales bacterium]|nr:DipZ protein [Solirubrobacterales bacterium]